MLPNTYYQFHSSQVYTFYRIILRSLEISVCKGSPAGWPSKNKNRLSLRNCWRHGSDDDSIGFWAQDNHMSQVLRKSNMWWRTIRKILVDLSWNAPPESDVARRTQPEWAANTEASCVSLRLEKMSRVAGIKIPPRWLDPFEVGICHNQLP